MSENYERWMIANYEHWAVFLHTNQYFLGRVYIWSKRVGLVDLMHATPAEWQELRQVGERVRAALMSLFAPDLFNWASLGNLSAQCHLQVIPRYATSRTFAGATFVDERWGKNYAPYDYDFKVDEPVLEAVRDAIAKALEKHEHLCDNCGRAAEWVRRTQFAGDHYFCESDAQKEEDFGHDDSSSFLWEQL